MSRLGERGFTLIEVVVAMAILGLLLSLVYSALGGVVRVHDVSDERIEDGARLRITHEFLARTLSTAEPIALPQTRQDFAVQFEGDAERLRFMAELPAYVGVGGLHELILVVDERDTRRGLWLGRRAHQLQPQRSVPSGEFAWRLLAEDISQVAFRYFGALGNEDEPRWRDDWSPGLTFPELIEVKLTDDTGADWPTLRVRPHTTVTRYSAMAGRNTQQQGNEEAASLRPVPSQRLQALASQRGEVQ